MADVTGTFYAGGAEIGYGTEFLVGQGDSSPETFAAVSDVIEINIGGFTADIFEKTHLRSIGRAKEKAVGLADYDPITLRCNYNPNHGSHNLAGGDGFDATHNLDALNRSLAENNFLILVGNTSPRREIAIRGAVSGKSGPTFSVGSKMEITYTITPLNDYR